MIKQSNIRIHTEAKELFTKQSQNMGITLSQYLLRLAKFVETNPITFTLETKTHPIIVEKSKLSALDPSEFEERPRVSIKF